RRLLGGRADFLDAPAQVGTRRLRQGLVPVLEVVKRIERRLGVAGARKLPREVARLDAQPLALLADERDGQAQERAPALHRLAVFVDRDRVGLLRVVERGERLRQNVARDRLERVAHGTVRADRRLVRHAGSLFGLEHPPKSTGFGRPKKPIPGLPIGGPACYIAPARGIIPALSLHPGPWPRAARAPDHGPGRFPAPDWNGLSRGGAAR